MHNACERNARWARLAAVAAAVASLASVTHAGPGGKAVTAAVSAGASTGGRMAVGGASATAARASVPAAGTLSTSFSSSVRGSQSVRAMPAFNHHASRVKVHTKDAARAVRMKKRFNAVAEGKPGIDLQRRFNKPAAADGPYPPNRGFAQGAGRNVMHPKDTVMLRYGGPGGSYLSTDLRANASTLALPRSAAGAPAHYYKLTAPITAPTGPAAAAYNHPGGATQVLLSKPIEASPLRRTIAPNLNLAAARPTTVLTSR
jgi:hypothetical protein